MNLPLKVDIYKSPPKSQYQQIYPDTLMSTNVHGLVNIDESTSSIDFNKSILMDLPSLVDIRESFMTG